MQKIRPVVIIILTTLTCLTSAPAQPVENGPLLWSQDFEELAPGPAHGPEWKAAMGIRWQTEGTREHATVAPLPESDGSGQALEVWFEKGRFSDNNGIGWVTSFRNLGLESDRLPSALLIYRFKFEEGFEFGLGGKLPGLVGGENASASGGNHPDGTNGWTTRYMFQPQGEAILYPYLPPLPGSPYGKSKWGDNLKLQRPDGSPVRFEPGRWHTIAQLIEINTPGVNNGKMRVWLDGELVLSRDDVGFRTEDELEQSGAGAIYFSAFFGGNTPDWSSPRDQRLWIDDVKLYAPSMSQQEASNTPP